MNDQNTETKLQRLLNYLEQDKNNIALLTSISDCYRTLNDDKNTQKYLSDINRLTARKLLHLQRTEEAVLLLNQAIAANPNDAECMGLLALVHFDQNNTEKANLLCQSTLTLDPANPMGQLVRLLLQAHESEVSVEDIQTLIDKQPDECRLWFILGTTQMQQMNVLEAERAFIQATTLWPAFYDAWISMGWCHLLQNNLNNATKTYNTAIEINAEIADGWGGLALTAALNQNIEQAKDYFNKAQARDPECFFLAVTSIILNNQDNPQKAGQQFNAAFPKIAAEMNKILLNAVMATDTDGRVLH